MRIKFVGTESKCAGGTWCTIWHARCYLLWLVLFLFPIVSNLRFFQLIMILSLFNLRYYCCFLFYLYLILTIFFEIVCVLYYPIYLLYVLWQFLVRNIAVVRFAYFFILQLARFDVFVFSSFIEHHIIWLFLSCKGKQHPLACLR